MVGCRSKRRAGWCHMELHGIRLFHLDAAITIQSPNFRPRKPNFPLTLQA
jgi:hypothetical protein